MPDDFKTRQARRRRQAVASAAVSAFCQAFCAGIFLWLRRSHFPEGILSDVLLIAALLELVLLIPLALSLRRRLNEIQGGEEDEARQY